MSSEQAVRQYITFLRDPQSLREEEKVEAAKEAIAQASDPIDEMKARAQLKAAETIDGDVYRAEFVAVAKDYADSAEIPVSVLQDMGVPDQDLRDAGFVLTSSSARSRQSGVTTIRSRRVTSEDVQAAAMAFDELFTVADLEERSGASMGTVRKVVAELVGSGALKEAGEDPDWIGRGRAPMRYDNS